MGSADLGGLYGRQGAAGLACWFMCVSPSAPPCGASLALKEMS